MKPHNSPETKTKLSSEKIIIFIMNKAVSSVTENQFAVSADLLLYTKLVPKIGSILELRTNAESTTLRDI
jgi:hypothetical protein